jgi:hypothetical protein
MNESDFFKPIAASADYETGYIFSDFAISGQEKCETLRLP